MDSLLNCNSFLSLQNECDVVLTSLRSFQQNVNSVEVEEINDLLGDCDIVLNGDNLDEIMEEYGTIHKCLKEFVIKKRSEIQELEEKVSYFTDYQTSTMFIEIIEKKKCNVNEIISCMNRIVDRIKDNLNVIHNKKLQQLDQMVFSKYEVKQKHNPNIQLTQQPIYEDVEMNVINNSMELLKMWSKKRNSIILFDSNVDGDGSNNILVKKVFNRGYLYFISSDDNGNIFGGYVPSCVYQKEMWIKSREQYIFSLIRNGKTKYKKYLVQSKGGNTFKLFSNNEYDYLYAFGNDMWISKVGSVGSYCRQMHYNYYNEENALVDELLPHYFQTKRIIVLKMS